MAVPSGLDAQIGFGEETTWGTAVTPDTFYEFLTEDINWANEDIDSEALHVGYEVLHEDQYDQGRVGIEGPVSLEWADRGMYLPAKHMLGQIATSQPDAVNAPTVFEHVAELGSTDGLGLTVQVGRPDASGVVQPFTYNGCKFPEWEMSAEVGGVLTTQLQIDGVNEDTGTALAAADFVASQRRLYWTGASLTVGGSEVEATSLNLSGNNALRTDRYFMRTGESKEKREQLRQGRRVFEGSIAAEFDGLTLYNLYKQRQTAAIQVVFEGGVIEDAFTYKLTIDIPVARFGGDTPNVNGAEAIMLELPFEALYDGTNSPVKFTMVDNQAAPA